MSQSLFRDEVLQARRAGGLGAVSLVQPLRFWLLTLVAVGAAASIVLFVCLGTYTRRSTVVGQLVPTQGLISVLSPATGVVAWLDVAEGERVRGGGALAMVSVPRELPDGGDVQVVLEHQLQQRHAGLLAARNAHHEQLSAQSQGLAAQLRTARREVAQIEAEIGTRRQQIGIAEETLQRLRRLENSQFVSILQIKQQETALLEIRGQMQALQRQATSLRRLMDQLQQARRELPGQQDAREAGYRLDLAQLEKERVQARAEGALVIKAPVGGLIASQLVKPGQAVRLGQPLMSLLPGEGRLEAELWVPSRSIGFIEIGDEVMLRYHAFPYQKFGHQKGRVTQVSRSAHSAGDLGAPALEGAPPEPFYRLIVALPRQAINARGGPENLKPGMALDADLMGDRRRIIEWIIEPLQAVGWRVAE